MFEGLKGLLSLNEGDDPSTPEDVRDVLEGVRDGQGEVEEKIEALREKRDDLLLEAETEEEIEEVEAEIDRAELELERLEAAEGRLEKELEAARQRQKVQRIQQTMDEAEAAQEEGEELLEEFAEHAEEMVAILERIEELDAVVSRAEAAHRGADREITREVERPEEGFRTPARPNGHQAPPITESTEIPPVGPDAPRWGSVRWREPKTGKTSSPSDTDHKQRPAGVYDEDGNPVDGRGVVRARRGTASEGI